jgi:antitoxin YefM
MKEMSVHEFRSHLREAVEEVVDDHVPLRVKRRGGQDFVVVSAEDWEREQETLYVLQNKSLMEQIERSLKTHGQGTGYRPSPEELDALDRV